MFDFIKDPEAKKVADIITRHYAKKSDVVLRVKSFLQRHERLPLGVGEFGFVTEGGSDYLVWRPSGGSKKGELFYAGPAGDTEGSDPIITYDSIDFTTWTENDTFGEIAVTTSTVTWTNQQRGHNNYVGNDFGAGYFSSTFRHRYKLNVTASALLAWIYNWFISDVPYNPGDASAHFVGIFWYSNGHTLYLREVDGGSIIASDSTTAVSLSTDYYIQVDFDDTVGSYGKVTVSIYSDSDFSSLVDSLSLTLSTNLAGRYMRVNSGLGDGSGSQAQSGSVSNLQFANNL